MKRRLGSVVILVGSLTIGLCVHRALLFKVNITNLLLFIAFYSFFMLSMFVLNAYDLYVKWKNVTFWLYVCVCSFNYFICLF
jgi:hypothetical protein